MRKKITFSFLLLIAIFFVIPFTMGMTHRGADQPQVNARSFAQTSIPTCMNRVDIPESELHWIYVPESATELHTEDNLLWLAGRLISSNVVNASDCPAGGIGAEGYANACGMSRAKPQVIEIQNSLNQAILNAWVDVGVPPVLLKQMIRYESQYWPAPTDNQIHYGLGHVTTIGILNALEWNPSLLQKACSATTGTCTINESLAATVLQMMTATCATCPNGINQARAEESVDLLARVVMGYCDQTAQLIFNATGWHSGLVVNYPTIWKLTLMNYNAGSTCVFDTVRDAFKATEGPVSWSDILAYVSGDQCRRGVFYANQITAKVFDFPPE